MSEETAKRWQKTAASGVAVLVLAAVLAFRSRLGADFWPLDSSRVGPNLIASIITWAVLFVLAVLLWPPWRRRLHRFMDLKLAPLHRHHELVGQSLKELHQKIEELHDSHAEIHRKLDELSTPTKEKPRKP